MATERFNNQAPAGWATYGAFFLKRGNKLWHERRADFAAMLVIVLFFILFFWTALFGGRFLLAGDPLLQSLPLRTAAWDAIRGGSLPLWTPLIFSGYPMASMAQLGLAYPLTWGYLFLPGHWAEQIYVLAPYLLSPLFVYLYAREIGRSRMAALLAGLSFGYGGAMVCLIGIYGISSNSAMWLPLILFAIERSLRRRFAPSLLLAAGGYAMAILNGHGQYFVYTGIVVIAYGAFLSWYHPWVRAASSARGSDQRPIEETRTLEAMRTQGAVEAMRTQSALEAARTQGAVEAIPTQGALEAMRAQGWKRVRPLAVAIGAVALASGVSAFQIAESLRAAAASVRAELSYEVFTYGSFSLGYVWKSLLEPLHNSGDVSAYAPPLAFFLAVVAAVMTVLRKPREGRVLFWLCVTAIACVLMMGLYTPLGPALYHIPVINRFRIPSRHSFEWTFGLSVLSAYGWDALKGLIENRMIRSGTDFSLSAQIHATGRLKSATGRLKSATGRLKSATGRLRSAPLFLALACLALGAAVGAVWWRAMGGISAGPPLSFTELHGSYLGWKAALFLLTLIAAWQSFRISARRWRIGMLTGTVILACFVEPYIQLSHSAIPHSVTADRFNRFAPTTDFLRLYPAEQNRVYTQIAPGAEAHSPNPHVDPMNLTALAGLHNVAGYEPLMLERYSRALNSSQWETVNRGAALIPDQALFEPRSHVLDLLNTGFVVSYSNLRADPESYVEKDGIKFAARETLLEVGAEAPLALSDEASGESYGEAMDGDTIALVTTLANAAEIGDGAPVAKIIIHVADGPPIERALRAGYDTAEWAHERADVRASARHKLAPVYDTRPNADFPSYRYLARIDLGERRRVARVEIVKLLPQISVVLWKASLYDSATRGSTTLSKSDDSNPLSALDSARWETVYQKDGALILRNKRALPRAWLVTESEAVTEMDGWRRIRGLSDRPFDPRRTALLETDPNRLPSLSGGPLAASAAARIVSYKPDRLVIETNADKAAFLVVSELYYPGWIARVDGVETPIFRTNFLLRGVALPAGERRVEMLYAIPKTSLAAVISLCSLLLIGGLAIYAGRPTYSI